VSTPRAVIAEERIWEGEMVGVRVDGVAVLLVRAGGALRAYRDACAHQGVRLSQGTLEGTTLTCRAHGWCYDVATGRGINPCDAQLVPLALEVKNGQVLVDARGGTP
jgi:toluene monooxygenase system ferredoxin subunit